MKKIMISSAAVLVALVVLGVAGYAYAQTQEPGTNPGGFGGRGGMMGTQRGMMGGPGISSESGLLHTYMLNAMAEALDMTPEDLQARMQAGDTAWTIAQEKGISQEEFFTLMKEARAKAITQAVADGVITQAQADWMSERMNQMQQNGNGLGSCQGGAGHHNGRSRWNTQPVNPKG